MEIRSAKGAHGIDRQHLSHTGLAGLEVNGPVNVHALASARLVNRDLGVLGRPAAHGPRRMGRVHGVGEHHRLVVGQCVQEDVISLDKGLLFGHVELS